MLPEAVNEFAYPPLLGKKIEGSLFSLSLSDNTVSDCNGCKSIHSKVKQFVLLKLPLCLCTKLYQMISYAKAPSHDLQNAEASSAGFVCLVTYWIEDIFSFRNIFSLLPQQGAQDLWQPNKEIFSTCVGKLQILTLTMVVHANKN